MVGGYCIGVDPYYLTHKAVKVGYNPEIILAGRRINDQMGAFVANQLVKLMIIKEHKINNSRVLVLGITFKGNCPEIRNSRIIDVINELKSFGCSVDVYDPLAEKEEVKHDYGIDILCSKDALSGKNYEGIILAVSHNQFKELDFASFRNDGAVIYDVKGILEKNLIENHL